MRHLQLGEIARALARDQLRRRAFVIFGDLHLPTLRGDVVAGEEVLSGADEKAGAGAAKAAVGLALAPIIAFTPAAAAPPQRFRAID